MKLLWRGGLSQSSSCLRGPPVSHRINILPVLILLLRHLALISPRFSPPLNSRTSSPSRSPIHSLIAAAQDSPPDRSSTDTTGAPCSAGHLAWSNSNGTPYWNSMSSLHGTPKLLRDRDKPGNLTPNDAHNFAIRPSVPPPAPKRATQASRNNPAPPSSYDTGVEPAGGGLSHQFQRPHYITSRDLHPRNPLPDGDLSSPACWQPDFQPNNQRCRRPN